jgi:type IV pilus assembly protein PilP
MQRIPTFHRLFLFALIVSAVLTPAVQATGEITSADSIKQPSEEVIQKKIPAFEYKLEGRPDPFAPFISRQIDVRKIKSDEIIDENKELTGMQRFEPGQLTLVAVLYSGNKHIAMVEDVTGKGYMLNEGTPIGRHGVVSRIALQQVVITETAHTRAGKEIKNTIVMRLNKEGEQ